jgi:aryl-alcohol dehydrogenase-like predicted oxidoreductase
MEHRRLGRTALQVSELCLGTMNFGPNTNEADSFDLLDHALDSGIDFIDTADQYGGSLGVGATETIIGNWLAQGGDRRERIVLATKLYEPMSERPNDRGLSARHIRLACDASLRRLQTDHIDLYQMHHIDRTAPWDEVWQAMETLVAQGKISYVGSSNFAGWTIAQANEAAASRHFLGLVSEQSLYNLVERTIELEVIPACEAYGVGVLPWSPLAGGLLAGVLSADDVGRRSSSQMRERVAAIRPQLEAWEELCSELGESSATIGLAWLLHQSAVTAPIVGPRTMEQLDDALRAPSVRLADDVLARLDEIFPGPGPAPEAYAW